jgi:hypothetical protein
MANSPFKAAFVLPLLLGGIGELTLPIYSTISYADAESYGSLSEDSSKHGGDHSVADGDAGD